MDHDPNRHPMTTDQELGSPAWTLEKGWLAGLVVGFVALVVSGRRKARLRRWPSAS